MEKILAYYSRKEIQRALLIGLAKRESVAKFNDSFGKRPDIIQYERDIYELAKQGATSFHISEEHWSNPLQLKPGMHKSDLDKLRIGWDLLIDIDSDSFEHSQITAYLLVEALKFHDITNLGVKFSGNKGFHIYIPFNAFPSTINNKETRLLFPEGPRVIASYLKNMIKPMLAEKLNNPDPFSITDIDTILISSRHLFRAPYSLNEKSGLVSIPILPERILEFKKEEAQIEKVETGIPFLEIKANDQEASNLIMQAYDFELRQKKEEKVKHQDYKELENAISLELFPPCMHNALKAKQEDGRKRTIFILINFLRHVGWDFAEIEKLLLAWNAQNEKSLPEAYLRSQVNWAKNQGIRLPPNCDNPNYYTNPDLNICTPDNFCKKIKNPVNYAKRKQVLVDEQQEKKPRRKVYKSKE